MDLWQYILASTPSLGLWEWLVIFSSALVAVWSIVLPNMLLTRQPATGLRGAGLRAYGLHAELWTKVGTGTAVWCGALILSLLLRLVGTYGLSTHLLMALVILALPLLGSYVVIYRLALYPRYLEVCRQIDTLKSYEHTAKKSSGKKARTEPPIRKQRAGLLPGKALIGMFAAPIVYYLVMAFVSIPPYLPPQNHDHLLHQLGSILMAMVGYSMGLLYSLGDDLRPMVPWLKVRQGVPQAR